MKSTNTSAVSSVLNSAGVQHLVTASSAAPEVKTLRCLDLFDFLSYCNKSGVIQEADIPNALSSVTRKTGCGNDSYVGGWVLYDAQHYAWNEHEELMQRIGAECRKLYPQRIDILWVSW